MLSNAYFLAKFGFDAEENGACKVCPLSAYRSPRFPQAPSTVEDSLKESLPVASVPKKLVADAVQKDIGTKDKIASVQKSIETLLRGMKFPQTEEEEQLFRAEESAPSPDRGQSVEPAADTAERDDQQGETSTKEKQLAEEARLVSLLARLEGLSIACRSRVRTRMNNIEYY